MSLYDTLANSHPTLARGLAWCRRCGRGPVKVNSAECLATGWPKCCGETMTIDHPDTWPSPPSEEVGGE